MKKVGLNEKLQQDLERGNVNLSSADVADFGKSEAREETKGDIVAPVPKEAENDTMINKAASGEPGQELNENVRRTAEDEKAARDPSGSCYAALPEAITLTQRERDAFLDTLISGDRFTLPFTIFNDRVTGTFRCRSQKESQAIITQVNRECREEKVTSPLDYSTRLRNMLLAAQVAELNGDAFPPLKEPLVRTVEGEDKITPAGWLEQVALWESKNEGLVSAIYHELQLFERKYWTMVNNANDQDFWNPAGSTSV